jgi:transposase
MGWIPTKLTPTQFETYIAPYLSQAKRGFVCQIPLYKVFNYILYLLHTGCQWYELPITPDPFRPGKPEMSWQAVYLLFCKWCVDGSFERVWITSLHTIHADIDASVLTLDGSHSLAKKGGEDVAYQGRKKAKTSNILPIFDRRGHILASTEIVAGNHNDAFQLKDNLRQAFKDLRQRGICIQGAYLNADSAFDTRGARQACFNYEVIPNIAENKRNRKQVKRGRKRLFNAEVYKQRYAQEHTFAWMDKFKRLLIRFERREIYFYGLHCIAFAMINLRDVLK